MVIHTNEDLTRRLALLDILLAPSVARAQATVAEAYRPFSTADFLEAMVAQAGDVAEMARQTLGSRVEADAILSLCCHENEEVARTRWLRLLALLAVVEAMEPV